MGRLRNFISEMIAPPWGWFSFDGLRSSFRSIGTRFWPNEHPAAEGTVVNYDFARSLYRNSNDEYKLGSGFAKPVVNLQVSFVGLPRASTNNQALDDFLNECLRIHWPDEIQQMIRAAIRDSKVVIRVNKPDVLDPLMTLDEAEHCQIEILPPERVDIERSLLNKNVIEKAVISHRMTFITDPGDPQSGQQPQVEEHDVLEEITRTSFRFFDQQTNQELTDLRRTNNYNLVPLVEVYNEWDATLQGGQSDLESPLPFMKAFHDVLSDGLKAHKYHSTPKVKFKLNDILPFIANNFPEAVDPDTKQIKSGAQISWRGNEIIFLETEENAEFMEAKSVLGDTKSLLEFLLDCICIAAETPEWAFMRVDSGSANSDRNAQTVPFIKKVERKRVNFTKPVQEICKIVQVIRDTIPVRPELSWEIVRPDDEVVHLQAFQQLMMGLEVARQAGKISDETYVAMMRHFVPVIDSPKAELAQAERDNPPLPMQLPVGGNGNGNLPIQGGPQGRNE